MSKIQKIMKIMHSCTLKLSMNFLFFSYTRITYSTVVYGGNIITFSLF